MRFKCNTTRRSWDRIKSISPTRPSIPRRIFFRPLSFNTALATSLFSLYRKNLCSCVLWIVSVYSSPICGGKSRSHSTLSSSVNTTTWHSRSPHCERNRSSSFRTLPHKSDKALPGFPRNLKALLRQLSFNGRIHEPAQKTWSCQICFGGQTDRHLMFRR